MQGFITAFGYPIHALGILRRDRELRRLVLIPLLINLVLGGILYAALLFSGLRAIDRVLADLPEWARFLDGLISALLVIALLIAIGYVIGRFGVVFGSPFYGQLSEKLERQLLGTAPPADPLTLPGILHELGRAISFELKKLLLALLFILPILLINGIPGLGQIISLIGQIALGALIACLDFFDPPLERRKLSFRAKLDTIRRMLPGSAAFGLVCFGLVSIPLLNLFLIPVCIVAGTLFFCERNQGT